MKTALSDDYFEKLKFKNGKSYQVPVSAIEKATGIKFSAWKNVNFPYTSGTFRLVKGSKLKKPRALASIRKAKEELTKKKLTPTEKRMSVQLRKVKSLSGKLVKEIEKRGPSVLLKKYSLKNVTL